MWGANAKVAQIERPIRNFLKKGRLRNLPWTETFLRG